MVIDGEPKFGLGVLPYGVITNYIVDVPMLFVQMRDFVKSGVECNVGC